jgi:NTP pyrophosphatase (non-canonical NTP hydrolase)
MEEINKIIEQIIKIRNDRNWKQFHNPKDLALSLVLEAGEVMEHFQWKDKEEVEKYIIDNKDEIGEEIADVLYWVLLMSHDLNINILEVLQKKLKKIEDKYPIEKSKGNHTKYNKL